MPNMPPTYYEFHSTLKPLFLYNHARKLNTIVNLMINFYIPRSLTDVSLSLRREWLTTPSHKNLTFSYNALKRTL